MLAVGMFGLSIAETKWTAALAGIIYGMSVGINMPAIMAWTADLAKPGRVALAMGTMLMSLELGIGVGAVYSGYQFQGDLNAISGLYAAAGAFGLIGFIVLLVFRKKVRDPGAE